MSCSTPEKQTKKEQVAVALEKYYEGRSLERQRNLEEAAQKYRESIEISPRPVVYYRLAEVLRALGRIPQAKYSVNQALDLVPDYQQARLLNVELNNAYPNTQALAFDAAQIAEAQPQAAQPSTAPPETESPQPTPPTEPAEPQDQTPLEATPSPEPTQTPQPTPTPTPKSELPSRKFSQEDEPTPPVDSQAQAEPPIEEAPLQPTPTPTPLPAVELPGINPDLQQQLEKIDQLADNGQWELAARQSQSLLQSHPNEPQLYLRYGFALVNLGQLEQAEQAFRKTIELSPGHAEAYNNLGVVLESQGQVSEAEQYYQRAIDIGQHPDAYYNLAVIKEKKGDYKTAIQLYQQFLQLKPTDAYAQHAQNRINVLRRYAF